MISYLDNTSIKKYEINVKKCRLSDINIILYWWCFQCWYEWYFSGYSFHVFSLLYKFRDISVIFCLISIYSCLCFYKQKHLYK